MTCVRCMVAYCSSCQLNAAICGLCGTPYGLVIINNTCVRCIDPNCYHCRGNYLYCYQCYAPYGVNITIRNCIPCSDFRCQLCTFNADICVNCTSGFGVSSGLCTPCSTSPSACLDCNSVNILECTSCPVTRYLSGTLCLLCMLGCDICNDSVTCTTCSDGYYL